MTQYGFEHGFRLTPFGQHATVQCDVRILPAESVCYGYDQECQYLSTSAMKELSPHRRRLLFSLGIVLNLTSTAIAITSAGDSMPHWSLVVGFVIGSTLIILSRVGGATKRGSGRLLGGQQPQSESDEAEPGPVTRFFL
ncbi:MAG: hypothetical protein ACI841_001153 [Planctomycetota bacterium]|jgi:hypothetical protein